MGEFKFTRQSMTDEERKHLERMRIPNNDDDTDDERWRENARKSVKDALRAADNALEVFFKE